MYMVTDWEKWEVGEYGKLRFPATYLPVKFFFVFVFLHASSELRRLKRASSRPDSTVGKGRCSPFFLFSLFFFFFSNDGL